MSILYQWNTAIQQPGTNPGHAPPPVTFGYFVSVHFPPGADTSILHGGRESPWVDPLFWHQTFGPHFL